MLTLDSAPRILFVDNQVDDFVQYRLTLAAKLRQCGFDVHVALPEEDGFDEIAEQGITVHRFHIRRMSLRPQDELRTLVTLLHVFRRVRPTLVHHFCLKPALYGGLAARLCDVPSAVSTFTGLGYLFTAQTTTVRMLRAMTRTALRVSFRHGNHVAVFQNHHDRSRFVHEHVVPAKRAIVINGSGVDLSVFRAQPEPDGPPVVLLASRLLWEKGIAEFVGAAGILRRRGIAARFVIAGEPDPGHPSAIPTETLHTWRETGDVEWLGWRDDIAGLIAASHVVCLPSYYGEGIPRILIEAAAAGRPIIGTEACGSSEIITHGENGLIVRPCDSAALAEAMATLINDGTLRRMMSRRGQAIATEKFSLETVIDTYCAIYRSVLHQHAARQMLVTKI